MGAATRYRSNQYFMQYFGQLLVAGAAFIVVQLQVKLQLPAQLQLRAQLLRDPGSVQAPPTIAQHLQ